MTEADDKAQLHRYLQRGREALLWKLDGLSEYDVRRPFTATGTNLLGLVKHVATTELFYFSDVFDRPFGEKVPWIPDDLDEATIGDLSTEDQVVDFWATADESREQITSLYRRVWVHSDGTINALRLDAPGYVPWWGPENRNVTLRQILIHMVAETDRHAGHADIVRELIDGAAGLNETNTNLPDADAGWWQAYVAKLEQVARAAGER
ncbi:MAG TPA: DinB family protein [Streptosporangiaceae bacterium]|nr:DinB family protein [Streptosporangiaceae bacterium]